jgi:hypothetical protein
MADRRTKGIGPMVAESAVEKSTSPPMTPYLSCPGSLCLRSTLATYIHGPTVPPGCPVFKMEIIEML